MKTIRKGNDIVVRWRIFRYGQEYDIASIRESISLILSNMGEKKEITDYSIVDVNTIVFKYLAKDQGLGIYRLLLIDKSRNSTRIIEECNAFRLVNTSDAANNDDTLESAITITLTSELTAPADGLSAYEVALQNGFIGTEEEWLQSLKGEQGPQGIQGDKGDKGDRGEQGDKGLSAYQVAIANGFVGTEAEWLQSLVPDTTDIELAEAQRQAKELERIEAENARQSAEVERQQALTEAISSTNAAATNANAAASNAQQKAEEANNAAVSANSAASSANAVVDEFNSIIVQETGAAQNKVMSQKAVTDAMTASQAKLSELVDAGYVFAGVATPTTNPGVPDAKVFYIANGKGTYTYFGKIVISEGEVAILKYDTSWSKEDVGLQNLLLVDDCNIPEVDFAIQDPSGNTIVLFKDGHIITKNYESDSLTIGESTLDLHIADKNDNIIVAFSDGYPITKNFNGKDIAQRLTELEQNKSLQEWRETWSRMPKRESNPLANVRFDGGMCRIFRKWGFIGDSLNSGEMYGRVVSVFEKTEIQNKALSSSGIVDDSTSIITSDKLIDGYQPKIKLEFQSNTGLNGKILLSYFTDGEYTAQITGDSSLEYILSIPAGTIIALSYPKTNVPQILFQVTSVTDNYDQSWGQQLVRIIGAEGYNFSVGGEYAKRWCIGEDNNRRWGKAQQAENLKDVYTIALGVNDRGYWLNGVTSVVDYPCVTAYPSQSQYGSLTLTTEDVMNDVDLSDYSNNANSYAGWYAGIIQRIKSVRKDAVVFCITNPGINQVNNEWNQTIRILVEALNVHYGNETIFIVDLARYNPITKLISDNCNLNGHMSAFGYLYSAYQISTYIDWIIRENIDAFRGSSLIGTGSVVNDFDTFLL